MADQTEEYLEKIRAFKGLKNAIIGGIDVYKGENKAEFTLITDKAYTAEEEENARRITQEFLPQGLRASLKIIKRVPDEEGLRRRIYKFMQITFPAASAFLKEEDVEIEMLQSGANFYFDIASGEQSLFTSGKILDGVSAYLKSVYCGSFYGNVRIVEKEREEVDLNDFSAASDDEEQFAPSVRFFPVCGFKKIDGADPVPKLAVYLADLANYEEAKAICGTITYFEEKQYVKHNAQTNEDEQKVRFSITLNDGTGSARITYFPKKATVDKIRQLKTGDKIVVSGENEVYNGNLSFKASKINYGAQPEGFVPEARKGKPVPAAYHTVFPEEYLDYTQTGFFDHFDKPEDLVKNTFVVFDLETTGLNNQPAVGKMDRIIEIGAVKLVNGNVSEKFSSFVACPDKLSPEIVKLTGICDEDLIGAPTVDKVLADFFKFTDGCFLVGHNVQFDYRFVRYYGEENGYMFDQKQFDTLTLAQELLRGVGLANYKLNTIADYYGFTFNHHRAFDDALTTAKIFIELMKVRKKLP